MDRFSTELRADLQEVYGVDLAELFHKKRWRHLLALIDGLPTHSRYMAAILTDPEIAEELVKSPDFAEQQANNSGPSLVGYTQLNYQLADLNDGLKSLQATMVKLEGGKPGKPKPTPRPKTAIEEAKAKRAKEDSASIIDLFSHN